MSYQLIKAVHVACVVLAVLLFAGRLWLAAIGQDYRRFGPLRWIPHAVDTLLLLSAGMLAWQSAQYPFAQPWLTAKLLALPLYIAAGAVALDPSRKGRTRVTCGVVAMLTISYIVLVAITRKPLPY